MAHYPTQTPDERPAGFQAFTIAVATALRDRAPHLTRVCSGTQGLWSNDDPDAWLTPEVLALLDGIAADGYSKEYTARQKSMASMFDARLA
ncbi:MAG: hypothetical protein H0W82_07280 [Actinobacteria bacterium]|nr:hypothetical protein [Actinomycetota bacterium]